MLSGGALCAHSTLLTYVAALYQHRFLLHCSILRTTTIRTTIREKSHMSARCKHAAASLPPSYTYIRVIIRDEVKMKWSNVNSSSMLNFEDRFRTLLFLISTKTHINPDLSHTLVVLNARASRKSSAHLEWVRKTHVCGQR